jgi:hypothetical protein
MMLVHLSLLNQHQGIFVLILAVLMEIVLTVCTVPVLRPALMVSANRVPLWTVLTMEISVLVMRSVMKIPMRV